MYDDSDTINIQYHGKTTVLYCNVNYTAYSQNMFEIRTNMLPSDLQRQK